MLFVMILIRINSSETSASCAAGVKCFFIHYSSISPKICYDGGALANLRMIAAV